MPRLTGRVALVTGAARGQGRSHAVRLAAEGADVVLVDVVADLETVAYSLATPEDLADAARAVEALGRRALAHVVDVRDLAHLERAVAASFEELGRLDIVVANAGVLTGGVPAWELEERVWRDTIDVNLTGAWNTVKATVPRILAGGRGGSIILVSSGGALRPMANAAAYAASKAGVMVLAKALAKELGPRGVRVNSLHPGAVDTPMIHNDALYRRFRPDLEAPTKDDVAPVFSSLNVLELPWANPEDVSEVVAFLASDESRLMTGAVVTPDAGVSI